MMKVIPLVSSVYRPRLAREIALGQSLTPAIFVNGINGALAVTSIAISVPTPLTDSLVAIMAILFGPLVGFTVSSIYTRIETAVGIRLGGKASHDDLYRLFAWSFLPLTLAALVSSLILTQYSRLGSLTTPLAATLCLLFAACSIRNYGANVLNAHELSRTRGVVSLVLTFLLFIGLAAVSIGFLLFVFSYGVDTDMLGLNGASGMALG